MRTDASETASERSVASRFRVPVDAPILPSLEQDVASDPVPSFDLASFPDERSHGTGKIPQLIDQVFSRTRLQEASPLAESLPSFDCPKQDRRQFGFQLGVKGLVFASEERFRELEDQGTRRDCSGLVRESRQFVGN